MQRVIVVVRRLLQVVWALIRYFVVPALLPARRRLPPAERARRSIEYLGGAWVKVGQALALRFDLLPAEYCNELLKLLNEIQSFPYEVVRRTVKEEFGRYPEEMFASFDPIPLAAASIGQVHKATTFDGTCLAVKVQRPSIGDLFNADFLVMRLFAAGLDLISAFGGTSVRSFVDEFSRWTAEEIDYRTEARNAHRMWLFSQGDRIQVDSKVWPEYTSERVIATEFMNGICLLDVVRATQNSDRDYMKKLAEEGHDVRIIGRHICWNMLNQMFRDGFFHADLHPANLFVLPGDVIGYIDYGIVGRLSEEMQNSLRFYIRNLFQGNFEAAVDELLRWVTPSLTTDVDKARRELIVVLEDYRFGLSGPIGGKPLQITSSFVGNVMSVIRRHRLILSQSLTLYFKAVLTTDAVVFELAPDYDLFADLKRFFGRELLLDVSNPLAAGRAVQEIWAFDHQTTQVLTDISRIQSSGRLLEISLQTLQTRLVFYGVWALILGTGAYFFSNHEIFQALRSSLGIGEYWIRYALYAGTAVLLAMMWREGGKLTVLHRRPVRGDEVSDPSMGRVR